MIGNVINLHMFDSLLCICVAGNKVVTATINFSLSAPHIYDTGILLLLDTSKACNVDYVSIVHAGWIVSPSDTKDPEANTIRMWEKQLQELMRKRYTPC